MSDPAARGSPVGLSAWLEQRTGRWREIDALARAIERSHARPAAEAMRAIDAYREVARDLSLARRLSPGSRISRYLEALYARLHLLVYRRPAALRQELGELFRDEIPAIVRWLAPHIAWVSLLFVGSALAGWWLVSRFPELAALFASEQMIDQVQRGGLWTDDLLNVLPSSVLSIGILANNIAVSLFALCAGVFFGLGTLYIMTLNGLMLGGIFAYTAQYGLAGRLFEFVVAHGLVELSVICIAGAAGVALGESIARPGPLGRAQAFQQTTARVARLVLLLALLLVGAGFIEGYVSPDPSYSLASRIAIGASYWILMWLTLTGRLARPRRRAATIQM